VALSAATDETSVTINLPVTITLSLRTGKAAVVVAPGAAAVSRDDGEKSV
jgi:hypothetical protein